MNTATQPNDYGNWAYDTTALPPDSCFCDSANKRRWQLKVGEEEAEAEDRRINRLGQEEGRRLVELLRPLGEVGVAIAMLLRDPLQQSSRDFLFYVGNELEPFLIAKGAVVMTRGGPREAA